MNFFFANMRLSLVREADGKMHLPVVFQYCSDWKSEDARKTSAQPQLSDRPEAELPTAGASDRIQAGWCLHCLMVTHGNLAGRWCRTNPSNCSKGNIPNNSRNFTQQSIENTFVKYKVFTMICTKGHSNHLLPGRNWKESTPDVVSAGRLPAGTAPRAQLGPHPAGTELLELSESKTDLESVSPAPQRLII